MVGRTYPPEFFHWIKNPATRNRFETMVQETEEDYKGLIWLLRDKFGVEILRPMLPDCLDQLWVGGKWVPPPTAPRDYFIMIHDRFFVPKIPNASHAWSMFYRQNKQSWWPDYVTPKNFYESWPEYAIDIENQFAAFQIVDQQHLDKKLDFYKNIFQHIEQQGNEIVWTDLDFVNGCFVSRIDKIYFLLPRHIMTTNVP
jgi:hypothetical protein